MHSLTNQETYKPTRFLAMSSTEEGLLVIYNSLTGAIGAVPTDQVSTVKEALKRTARHNGPLSGIVADLRDGGFLITENIDEEAINHRQYLNKYQENYLNLIVMPTEECNFRCVYCYESFTRGTMVPELVEGLKEFVRKSKIKRLDLSWFGGEPLLAKEVVIELTQYFHQYCADNGIQYLTGITTNASLLTPDVVEQLVPFGLKYFQVTIDGVQDEHDKKRISIDGQPSFERIINNLRYLKSTKYPFMVALRHNYDPDGLLRLEEFIAMIKSEFGNDKRFTTMFQPVGQWGGSNDTDLNVCDSRPAADAIVHAKRLAIEAGFHNTFQIEQFRPNGYVCYASSPRSFVIGSDGKVYKCTVELDYHDRNIVGQLNPDGSMQLDWRKMALWVETNGRDSDTKCNTCFFSPSCHGAVCPKQWMDENDIGCPSEKIAIRQILPLMIQESNLGEPVRIDPGSQCSVG